MDRDKWCAKEASARIALVDQDRQRKPDRHRADHIKGAEYEEIGIGDAPAQVTPQFRIMWKPAME